MENGQIIAEPRKILWEQTLHNIIYTHQTDTVSFSISEIESLSRYIEELNAAKEIATIKIGILSTKIDKLSDQILAEALKPMVSEKLSTFSVYG